MDKSLILFVVLVYIVPTIHGTCHHGWIRHGNTCYWFSDVQRNWIDAERFCQGLLSHLAEIPDYSTNYFLKHELKDLHYFDHNYVYYIGANDISQEGVFEWNASKTSLGFTDWGPHQPESAAATEDCVGMHGDHGFVWHDYLCDEVYNFICAAQDE